MMDRIVVVTKRTRLKELIRTHQTIGSARFFLESSGKSITPYIDENSVYEKAINTITRQLPSDTQTTFVEREQLPNFLFREDDFIIACGPDGLFVNLAQYITNQSVLTVNPDKRFVAGVLMLFNPDNVGEIIENFRSKKHTSEPLSLIKASIENGETLWAVNDIFIGRHDHVSARYSISVGTRSEHQSSSGIIICTQVGTTGWMRSIRRQVEKIQNDTLLFAVRESFESPDTSTSLIFGSITKTRPLVVVSEIPEGGCICSDGVFEKGIPWNAGNTVTISVGDRYINRIIS
jgi:NAD kinase